MRRRVTAIGPGPAVGPFTLKLLERDDCDVTVIGEAVGDANAAAVALGHEPRAVAAPGWPAIAGSDVVVVFAVGGETPGELATRCPGALVIVATAEPALDCAVLWPAWRPVRARLLGRPVGPLAGPLAAAADAYALLDHVLADRRRPIAATVLCQGEGGLEGWCTTAVHLGGAGLFGFATPPPAP